METLNRRDILQEVLTECGYSGWYVVEPGRLNTENFLLFNSKEKKMGEISIPDEWLDDPHQRSTIGESLAMTIENCEYALPKRS
jgi:hypothetical protein